MRRSLPCSFQRALALGALALAGTTAFAQPAPGANPPAMPGGPGGLGFGGGPRGFQPGPSAAPPAYPVPYTPSSTEEIATVLSRIVNYLDKASAIAVRDEATNEPVKDLNNLPERFSLDRTDFQIVSYEWGVTYASMLHAAEVTGDARYKDFADRRLGAIRLLAARVNALPADRRPERTPLRSVTAPNSLDDSGAMSAAMIKALQAGVGGDLRPLVDNYLGYISTKQKRFDDGTLARDRPLPNSLWLDDLYMSVPALAQMGKLTGDVKYYDDAVKQILQFSQRMFVKEKNLYMHGWVQGMADHPQFFWGRANGWAVLAMVELLSVLPENHPGFAPVLAQYRAHARGLAATQGINGLWHQLLDRERTYEETSASAMFVYAIARGINRGWLDPLAYGPLVSLGWNAVAEKVNAKGQVTDTCVGTGMGWEPSFYAYRPVSPLAAHGYGPVIHAGAEMITLRNGKGAEANVHDGGVHFGKTPGRPW